jgi:hypothetical protein
MKSRANLADLVFELNVNFLLYCALIIVFYMLVKFYIEDESFQEQSGYMKLSTEDADDEKIENQIELADHNDNENDDGKSNFDESKDHFRPMKLRVDGGAMQNAVPVPPGLQGSKMEIIQKISFSAIGLVVSFSIWGLLQERILTKPYDGDYFQNSYGLVFLNRLGGLILSAYLMYYFKIPWIPSPLWEYSFPSVANMLSSWCQYEALIYVRLVVTIVGRYKPFMNVVFINVFKYHINHIIIFILTLSFVSTTLF